MRFSSTAILITGLFPLPLFATHPLITDDTGTQGRGKFQIELTSEHGYEQEEGTRENTGKTNTTLT